METGAVGANPNKTRTPDTPVFTGVSFSMYFMTGKLKMNILVLHIKIFSLATREMLLCWEPALPSAHKVRV